MAAKKSIPAKKTAPTGGAPKPPTKSEILAQVADKAGISRKQAGAVFDEFAKLIGKNLKGSKAPGTFVVPGLMKIKVVKKPATKARKGINPFTGEEMVFKAKPARNTVKILPLKNLKSMV